MFYCSCLLVAATLSIQTSKHRRYLAYKSVICSEMRQKKKVTIPTCAFQQVGKTKVIGDENERFMLCVSVVSMACLRSVAIRQLKNVRLIDLSDC